MSSKKNARRVSSLLFRTTSLTRSNPVTDSGIEISMNESVEENRNQEKPLTPLPRFCSIPTLINDLKNNIRPTRVGPSNLLIKKPNFKMPKQKCMSFDDSIWRLDPVSEFCLKAPSDTKKVQNDDCKQKDIVPTERTNILSEGHLNSQPPTIIKRKSSIQELVSPQTESRVGLDFKAFKPSPSFSISNGCLHNLLNHKLNEPIYFEPEMLKGIGHLSMINKGKSILRKPCGLRNKFTRESSHQVYSIDTPQDSLLQSSKDKKVRFCKNIMVNVYSNSLIFKKSKKKSSDEIQ